MDITRSSRAHPTASERCHKWNEPSNTPLKEEGEENIKDEEATEKEVLTEPFPGGLTDITLLSSFKTHIAADIWNDVVRF